MREEAVPFQLNYKVLTIVLLSGVVAYTVLIYQLGRRSAQQTYTLPYNRIEHHTASKAVTSGYSVLKQKASLVAGDLWRYADTLVNQTGRSFLEDMAVNLAARILAVDRVSGLAEQRRLRLVNLAQRLLRQITRIQNPTDCVSAKFIVTYMPTCGFGCQAHHAAVALRLALAQNRTLFINGNAWNDIYLPVTNCSKPGRTADVVKQAQKYQTVGPMGPPGLTREWADALTDLHESPYAWFHGHLLRYILRLAPSTFRDRVVRDIAAIGPRPLAGLHIRRTDKLIREAKAYPISQYMLEVQRFYKQNDLEERLAGNDITYKPSPTAFLATDESDVFVDATQLYPQYRFSKSPYNSSIDSRASREGLEAISYVVLYLANCDFVVCTFSSNVCRLVYELMLTNMERKGDRTGDVHSLDRVYYIHGENQRNWTLGAALPFTNLRRGARVSVLQHFRNGSVKLTTGKVVSKYLLEEELQIIPGVL